MVSLADKTITYYQIILPLQSAFFTLVIHSVTRHRESEHVLSLFNQMCKRAIR